MLQKHVYEEQTKTHFQKKNVYEEQYYKKKMKFKRKKQEPAKNV